MEKKHAHLQIRENFIGNFQAPKTLESKMGSPGRCAMVALDFMAPQCSRGSPGPAHAAASWPSGRLECSWAGVSVNQTILVK